MDIDKLLQLMINKNGSDLFITADVAPSMKVNGKILPVGKTPLTAEQTMRLVKGVMTPNQQKEFEETNECQFAIADEAQQACQSFLPENYIHLTKATKPKTLTFDVCFTGFKKADKELLIEVAEAHSMTVRSSVTQNLQMLCCGYNAGPSKVNAARMKGTIIIDEESFVHFIETGEIPDA